MKTSKRISLLKKETNTIGSRIQRAVAKASCPICSRRELEVFLPDRDRIGRRRPCMTMLANADFTTKIVVSYRCNYTLVCSSRQCNSSWSMRAGERLSADPTKYMSLFQKVRPVLVIPFAS